MRDRRQEKHQGLQRPPGFGTIRLFGFKYYAWKLNNCHFRIKPEKSRSSIDDVMKFIF